MMQPEQNKEDAMNNFVYAAHPSRIIFGEGTVTRVRDEVEQLGCARAVVLCTPNQQGAAGRISELLGPLSAGVHGGAVMHVPVESVDRALADIQGRNADCLVAFGGGSTVGLAKALALRTALPIIAIPTTYAGSEVTPIYGITEGSIKRTGRDPVVLPKAVIYDPCLSHALPVQVSVNSGLNALAHAAEALYAHDRNPITDMMATAGIEALGKALPAIKLDPQSMEARSKALYGAWLCGTVLGQTSMGLHHKLCHTLGGSFNLPHAETHAVVLPHALAYNRQFAQPAMERIAAALGVQDAAQGLHNLAAELGAPLSLRELGMNEDGLDKAADLAVQSVYPNPRALERGAIRELLQRAFEGTMPA
jgi:maleylacetate reductase